MLLDDVVAAVAAAGIPCRQTRFQNPPASGAFCVWGDAVEAGGADLAPLARSHEATLLLVEGQGADGTAVAAVDDALDSCLGGMSGGWSRREREWYSDEKVYATEYSFSFIERRKPR